MKDVQDIISSHERSEVSEIIMLTNISETLDAILLILAERTNLDT